MSASAKAMARSRLFGAKSLSGLMLIGSLGTNLIEFFFYQNEKKIPI